MQFSEMMSWFGSILALSALLQGVIPSEYRHSIVDRITRILSPYTYFVVPELDGANLNDLYTAVRYYLGNVTAKRARVSNILLPKNAKAVTFSLASNQRIRDTYNNVTVEWIHNSERRTGEWVHASVNPDERRSFKVRMPYSKKDFLLESYMSYIVEQSKEIQRANRELQLFSNRNWRLQSGRIIWTPIPFLHPATFRTIAMDPELKLSIEQDLDEFVSGEKFYRRVGKAWKRGYLLFGPPGTGKSSVVAAMANKLQYDVYDLELTEVQSNGDLRSLLLQTSDKSIIVIEDIDCSLDLSGQRKKKESSETKAANGVPPGLREEKDESKVTLSGLLNFTDGLWSSCGSERIFIFTTNFIDKLDPALVRAGRMDFHINLGYCAFPAFKMLAKTFLDIEEHHLFAEVEREMQSSFMTPADVAEVFTKHKRDPNLAVEKVVEALRERKSMSQNPENQTTANSEFESKINEAKPDPTQVESESVK